MTARVRTFLRHFLLQAGWNYDRMQHLGVASTMLPELRRIHRTPEALQAAALRHLDYFNTQPFMAAPDAATSSSTIDASVMPRPPPPNCSGIAMPIQPPWAIAR